MENYELARLRIGRDIVSHAQRDFPEERMGIADKFLLNLVALNVVKEFDEKGSTTIMEEIVGKALTNSYYKRLAYLLRAILVDHPFSDGNKRTAS